MPDREKVASGLRHCLHYNGSCLDCPYDGPNCQNDVLDDAINLLKEQEAVVPKKVKGYNPPMYTLYEYECEECKSPMLNKQPFCMGCGRLVKWE